MNEAPKTKRGWRIARRLLIAAAILATLIAALVAEEDWRGKRAWENYKHQWEAKGEKFDWQAFVPPPVPADQNFFTAPIFTNMLNGKIVMTPYGNDGGPDYPPFKDLPKDQVGYIGGFGWGRITDLKAWQTYYRNPTNLHTVIGFVTTNGLMSEETNVLNHPVNEFPITPQPQTPAKDVLFALSKFDSAVGDLRQASERPFASVPIHYEDGLNTSASTLLPYLATLKRCTQLLQLRADAELADGQNGNALLDVKLLLYLNNSLRNSPFLISHLVRIALVAITMQPIWEGLAKHEWTDEQLAELDSALAEMDFLADYDFSMRGERAFTIAAFENQRKTREIILPKPNSAGYVTNKLNFTPSAYFYQNELAVAQMQQKWLLPLADTNTHSISPSTVQRAHDALNTAEKHYSPYKSDAMRFFSVLTAFAGKIAIVQGSIDLARVACALERYRLARGQYPETLDALAPQFIEKVPHDIIGGQPLHYRRTDDGSFVLYSVGWNGTDDGGKVVLRKGGSVDWEKGDWVWQYPAK